VLYCQSEVRQAARIVNATLAAALLWALCTVPALALATQRAPTVSLYATISPERLGGRTTIGFGFTIATPTGQLPTPLRQIDLLYPANLGIATSGLGLATCKSAPLEANGPPGCPRNSIIGYGSALVEVPLGPQALYETTRITTFMAPVHDGHLGLLFYAYGETPVSAQIVFPGLVLPAAAPFGGDLDADVPLVPTVPEGADAALVKLSTTLGPSHVTYYEYRRGHSIPYRPQGIRLPRTCPRGGFRFAAEFLFDDQTRAHAQAIVGCPRR
jgi:hypothetical protein